MAALMQKEVLESTTEDDREEKKEVQKNVIMIQLLSTIN